MKIDDTYNGKKVVVISGLNVYFEDGSFMSYFGHTKKVLKKKFNKDLKLINADDLKKINKNNIENTKEIKTTPISKPIEKKVVEKKVVVENEDDEFLKYMQYSGMIN